MEGNGQKETDISIHLYNEGTVNKNMVAIKRGTRSVNIHFSYETIVAVDGTVSINDWSVTTGKYLNELQPNKTLRVPHKEVLKVAQERLKWVLDQEKKCGLTTAGKKHFGCSLDQEKKCGLTTAGKKHFGCSMEND